MKSPIRWAGSKLKSLGVLRQLATSADGKYVEAFAGSSCLFFDVAPQKAVIGDLNPDLIRAFRSLRDDPQRVIEHLKSHPRDEVTYYTLRAQDPNAMVTSAAAARFFYLNRYCFNGLYRTNKAGFFNVPYGHLRKNESINYDSLSAASNLLLRATLLNEDFEAVVDHARAGDFVYLDPPYVTSGKLKLFAEYLPDSFSTADLERLERVLIFLDRRNVSFAVSYADCSEARMILERWKIIEISVRRNIAGFSGARKFATEIVATNVQTLTI